MLDMSFYVLAPLCAVLVFGFALADGAGGDDEAEEIRRAIEEFYFAGSNQQDFSLIERLFHPDTLLVYNHEGRLATLTQEQWRARFDPARAGIEWERRIEFVDVAGTVASAKVVSTSAAVQFIDYFNMVKVEGRWLVVNKVFHANRFGDDQQ